MLNNNYKIKRLENNIKYKIFYIMNKYINDNRIKNNWNITYINISNDFKIVKIFIIFIKYIININYYINILNNSSNFFKKKIFKNINIKFLPKLIFLYDYNFNRSIKILNLINEIKK